MAKPMLAGMLIMTLAFWAYAIAVTLARVRILIREREAHTTWLEQLQVPV
jgi:heme exporter protein C